MPDLGKYAFEVLAAYGASFGLLVFLIAATVIKGRRVRADMKSVEARGQDG